MSSSRQAFPIEAWASLYHPSDAQLSPDGQHVAFVYGPHYMADQDTPVHKEIHLIDTATGCQKRFTTGLDCTHIAPRWSPDSRRLVFLSNRASKDDMQLYVMDIDGGEAQPLTDLRGKPHDPAWSSSGDAILFLYDGAPDAEPPAPTDPIVMDANPCFDRVWRCDVASRSLTALTPATTHIFEYALSPDGTTLAVLAAAHPNPMEGWYAAQLYTVDVASQAMRQVCAIEHQAGRLTWSPDGTQIGFVSGVMSDEGNVSGDVFAIPAAGGQPRRLTPDLDHSITWIEWRAEGILYGGRLIDRSVIGQIDPQNATRTIIASGEYGINGTGAQQISAARGGQFATVRASFTEPPDIYLGSLTDGGGWRKLSDLPVDWEAFPPLRVESRHWTHPDGAPVQGFLIYPPDYTPDRRYPLFVHVHGGPSWCYVPDYYLAWERLLISRGCLVLMPNPRGSWGRGPAYQAANVGDLGGGDWQDIYAGIDPLIDEGLADPDRIAVGGWSYGGYLTTWAVTQTDRFRCAIAGACITNYVSNYGVVSNREWQTTMFGSMVYDAMDLHRSRSPISYTERVKTPTLMVHGLEDKVAPPTQPIEFYTALRYHQVPAELVFYPREPHGFRERPHQIDLMQRIAAWVDRYLLAE
ncbi:MAG TPA: alpha/beta fold hydrolase [Aggregatilinea sp.]|uniref:S9 family peptidase n=1 Tax=Aggregatilinea sp. TaxID=2806333 RepID=UPI002C8C9BFF|nr:alpha/beta fold hydrolase [Aggregatilinea sp.]HML21167.1 alpha/beta fold hydrolase [Aggregatilinea sp.]